MTSYTIEQYNALVAAIAEGALRVKYQDKEVEYRSLNDMMKIKENMEQALFPDTNPGGPRRMVAVYGSGL